MIETDRYALVQRDGDIVELDGTSPLGLLLAPSNYFVVVRQRNHLGVMTATPVSLTTTTTVVDFRTIGTATYGTGARKSVSGTYPAHVLWSGDVTFDGLIQYTGTGNDRDVILNAIGGGTPTAIATGYLQADVNLSGQTKYAGSANDRDVILQNIGGVVPTNTRSQQLP